VIPTSNLQTDKSCSYSKPFGQAKRLFFVRNSNIARSCFEWLLLSEYVDVAGQESFCKYRRIGSVIGAEWNAVLNNVT